LAAKHLKKIWLISGLAAFFFGGFLAAAKNSADTADFRRLGGIVIVLHQIIHSWYTGRWWVGSAKCNSPPINGHFTNHYCYRYMMVHCSAVLMWRLKG